MTTFRRPGVEGPLAVGRREVLGGLAATVAGAALAPAKGALPREAAFFLIPGYAYDAAYFEGRPVSHHPGFTKALPRGYAGPATMVTRLDEDDATLRRALMPVAGHEITVAPDGRRAFFNSLNGTSMVSFDPASLEADAVVAPHAEGYIGGGHAVYSLDGRHLFVAERRDWVAYAGRPEAHHGRIVVRDAESLTILEVIDCHGIAPHEVALLADARHLVVANYGRTGWPDGRDDHALPFVLEPSLTVIESGSGKLVHKIVSPDPSFEVRHVAAHDPSRIFAIQARLAPFADTQSMMTDWPEVYEPDVWSAGSDIGYLPAPVLRYRLDGTEPQVSETITSEARLMRYGQSIVYDPAFDQVIATFPSRHAVVVFDGADGSVVRVIRTDRLGLRQPRGVALHPDGARYVVSGYWQDLFVFRRGSHEIDRGACRYHTWFGHSHLAVG